MFKIHFMNSNKVVEVEKGSSILEAALDHGVPIYHTCGGNASCSTCRVKILSGAENLSPVEAAEAQVLDAFDLKPPYRLGCQAQLLSGDVALEIPDRARPPRPNKTPPLPEARRKDLAF